jgi:transcriptional regulator with XRE-family HTH domain
MDSKYSVGDQTFLRNIGKNIRSYREKNHISQEELANLAGIDRSYLGSVERGERNISAINIRKLARALSISVSQLLQNI